MSKLINVDEAIINFGFEWDDIPPTRKEAIEAWNRRNNNGC